MLENFQIVFIGAQAANFITSHIQLLRKTRLCNRLDVTVDIILVIVIVIVIVFVIVIAIVIMLSMSTHLK